MDEKISISPVWMESSARRESGARCEDRNGLAWLMATALILTLGDPVARGVIQTGYLDRLEALTQEEKSRGFFTCCEISLYFCAAVLMVIS